MQDVDLEEFARMFDAALASDKPAVKKALRNFMMVAAIAESDGERVQGPLESLVKEVDKLRHQVSRVEEYSRGRRYSDEYYAGTKQWSYDYKTSNNLYDDKEHIYKMLASKLK